MPRIRALDPEPPEPGAAPRVARSLARLREAGRALARRPRSELLDGLGALLDALRDPGSAPRRRLEAELPAATGFSAETVREGLDRALESWSGDALRALAVAELGPDLGEKGERRVVPYETTAVVLAGALPTPTLVSLIAPLALGSAVVLKPSCHDPVTPRVLTEALGACDAGLGAGVALADFRREDVPAMEALLSADCSVVTGSDETVGILASRVRPPRRVVAYGHRLSVAVLGPECVSGRALDEALERFALDVALWDQQGCLSPVALLAVVAERRIPETLIDALGAALAAAEERWPRGVVDSRAAAAIVQARAEAELRAAAGAAVQLREGPGLRWTIVAEADAALRPCPLHRFVRVHPVAGIRELLGALRPAARHLAAVGSAGFGDAEASVARQLTGLGATRVCRLGEMQAPPLSWDRGGDGVLLPLARRVAPRPGDPAGK